jgi:hypothetical protein
MIQSMRLCCTLELNRYELLRQKDKSSSNSDNKVPKVNSFIAASSTFFRRGTSV